MAQPRRDNDEGIDDNKQQSTLIQFCHTNNIPADYKFVIGDPECSSLSLGFCRAENDALSDQFRAQFLPQCLNKRYPPIMNETPNPSNNYFDAAITEQLKIRNWPKRAQKFDGYYAAKTGWTQWRHNFADFPVYFEKDKLGNVYITATALANLFERWALFIYIMLSDAYPNTVYVVAEIWDNLWVRGSISTGYLSTYELGLIVAKLHVVRDQNVPRGMLYIVRIFALRKIALYIYIYIYSTNTKRG